MTTGAGQPRAATAPPGLPSPIHVTSPACPSRSGTGAAGAVHLGVAGSALPSASNGSHLMCTVSLSRFCPSKDGCRQCSGVRNCTTYLHVLTSSMDAMWDGSSGRLQKTRTSASRGRPVMSHWVPFPYFIPK